MTHKYHTRLLLCLCFFVFGLNTLSATSYFWVGSGGNWTDYAHHWATTSGGSAFHSSIPGPNDEVVFDQNSFTQIGDTIIMDMDTIRIGSWHENPLALLFTFSRPQNNYYTTVYIICSGDFISHQGFSIDRSHVSLTFVGSSMPQVFQSGTIRFLSTTFTDNADVTWNADTAMSRQVKLDSANLNLNVNYLKTKEFYIDAYNLVNPTSCNFGSAEIVADWFFASGLLGNMLMDSCTYSVTTRFNVYNTSSNSVNFNVLNCATDDLNYTYVIIDAINARVRRLNVNEETVIGEGLFEHINADAPVLFYNNQYSNPSTVKFLKATKQISIHGSQRIDTLLLNNPGYLLTLSDRTILSVSYLKGVGSCSSPITIETVVDIINPVLTYGEDTSFIQCDSSGYIELSGVNIFSVIATGGASFDVTDAVVSDRSSGWNIISAAVPKTLYWVNGDGYWHDPSHWSLTSGGSSSGCIPRLIDNVIIEPNSFSSGGVIYFDDKSVQCHDIDLYGIPTGVTFTSDFTLLAFFTPRISISGDLRFMTPTNWDYFATLAFVGEERDREIYVDTANFYDVIFDGSKGSWSLNSDLFVILSTSLFRGKLNTNGHSLGSFGLGSGSLNVYGDTIILGTSTVNYVGGYVTIAGSSFLTLEANQAHFIASSFAGANVSIGSLTLKGVNPGNIVDINYPNCYIGKLTTFDVDIVSHPYPSPIHIGELIANGNAVLRSPITIDRADFRRNVSINSTMHFNHLKLNNPGSLTQLTAEDTLRADTLNASVCGTSGVIIQSSSSGTQAVVDVPSGNVCMDFASFTDIQAIGGATYNVGANSSDLGNNSGLSFVTCNQVFGDTIAPLYMQPPNIVYEYYCPGVAFEWEVYAYDNCGIDTVISIPPSGTVFYGGVTPVNFTVIDNSGNTATGSFTVNIMQALHVTINSIATMPLQTCPFGTNANVVIGYGGGPTSIQLNTSVVGGSGSFAYSWSPQVGLNDPSIANPVFTPGTSFGDCATYTFIVYVIDINTGCYVEDTITINAIDVSTNNPNKVKMCINGNNQTVPLNLVPLRLTQGYCLGSCTSSCSSFVRLAENSNEGEQLIDAGDVQVLPNPNNGQFTINIIPAIQEAPSVLTIYDLTGKLVYTQTFSESTSFTSQIDLRDFGSGIYLLKLSNGDFVYTQKIVVSNN
ncbi:MAG: T9SS type A sorting domain-containing protein [Bacteroidia bacterium]